VTLEPVRVMGAGVAQRPFVEEVCLYIFIILIIN